MALITPRLLITALLLLCAASSCRRHDLCEGADCAEGFTGSGGTTTSAGAAPQSGSGLASSAAGSEGGEAHAGADGDAGAGGEAATEPLQCDVGTGDCDYSRLTGCEAQLSWTIRHCGACGISCEDGCSAGKCLQSALLYMDAAVTSFVSTNTFVFATLSHLDGTDTFVRVRVDNGKADELLANIGGDAAVALGDRVYLFDPDRSELRSSMLDGNDLRVEPTVQASDMGAYPGGTYYISAVSGADDDTAYTLYYRPNASSPWQELKKDAGWLGSSSNHGVVYGETDADGVDHLYLLQADSIIPHGPAPLNTDQSLATADGITVLTHDYDTYAVELWWLTADSEPRHYALPPQFGAPRVRPYRDIVAVSLVDDKAAYVQTFDSVGPNASKLGVRLGSELLGLDDRHLWHFVTDDWFHWRFLSTAVDPFGF